MSNKVEPIDALAEALRKSCGLFNQLVSEHTRLHKLGSNDRPTEPCIRRVNGKGQILTAEEAITHDETKVLEQSLVLHGVEHDFLAAIKDMRESLRHSTTLAVAIEPIVDKPARWLAELLGEINSLELAAVYPPNALAPEQRMAALFAVLQRLDLLACSQEIGLQTTPAGTKRPELPSDEAMIAWRLRTLKGQKQREIADEMTQRLKREVKQPAVSKWLKEADKFLLAGGVFPDLPTMPQAPAPVDPTVIDMGKRVDGLSKHQRKQRSDAD